MSPAHTPGPWAFKKGAHRIEVRTTPERAYAFSLPDEANARLIASAPTLLEALEAVLPDLEHYVATHGPGPDNRLALARAAIAKAKGGAA